MLFSAYILLLTLLQANPVFASDLNQSKNTIQNKISKYLQHNNEIENHYLLNSTALSLFATKEDKVNNNPEFTLHFEQQNKSTNHKFTPNKLSDKPLTGLKVAIDPGHLGGDMAPIEDRIININCLNKKQIAEGTLTVITAKILKKYLTDAGANVLLTKDAPGKAAYSLSFSGWCAKNFEIRQESDWFENNKQEQIISFIKKNLQPDALQKTENHDQKIAAISTTKDNNQKVILLKQALFRFIYNLLDLNARTEKINTFQPNLTIVIHFNAIGSSQDVSDSNFNLTFIPGSFLANGLNDKRSRQEFARLLMTNDLEESHKLSRSILKGFTKYLSVPELTDQTYQQDFSTFIENGIYSRNLTLTRLVHGPICYGETLIQNNIEEANRLTQMDFEFENKKISSRLADVAKAYFYGICKYLDCDSSD